MGFEKVYAQDDLLEMVSEVYPDELHVEQVDDKLQVSFQIKNAENYSVDNILFGYQILRKENRLNDIVVVEGFSGENTYSLQSRGSDGDTTEVSDQISLDTLPNGEYILRISIYNFENNELGWIEKEFSFNEGDDPSFVGISGKKLRIVKDGEYYGLQSGVLVEDEELKLEIPLYLMSGKKDEIRISKCMDIYAMYYSNDAPVDTFCFDESQIVVTDEISLYELDFPISLNSGGTYEATIYFVDEEGHKVSEQFKVRFLISGSSVRILKLREINGSDYKKGGDVNIAYEVISSSDGNPASVDYAELRLPDYEGGTKIDQFELYLSVRDRNDNICGEYSRAADTSIPANTIIRDEVTIEVNKDCLDPIIKMEVYDGDDLLAKDILKVEGNLKQDRALNSDNKLLTFLDGLRYKNIAIMLLSLTLGAFGIYKIYEFYKSKNEK
jgi:hypothetical protein